MADLATPVAIGSPGRWQDTDDSRSNRNSVRLHALDAGPRLGCFYCTAASFHVLSGNGGIHSDIAYPCFGFRVGDKVLDIGCARLPRVTNGLKQTGGSRPVRPGRLPREAGDQQSLPVPNPVCSP